MNGFPYRKNYPLQGEISLAGIIKDDPNIEIDRLINHLNEFLFSSTAVNHEFLTQVRTKKGVFSAEANMMLDDFLTKTNPNS